MTKLAHITNRPGHEVGEKVLALCGKEFKVKALWADIPVEKPICRACVDTALKALTEADKLIGTTRDRVRRMSISFEVLNEVLREDLILDEISEADLDHLDRQVGDALAKAQEKRAKETCTCTWTSPEVFTEDPNCPIHGGSLDLTQELVEDGHTPLPEVTE